MLRALAASDKDELICLYKIILVQLGGKTMLSRLFGLKPPDIANGTPLQYSAGNLPRLCEDVDSMTGFCCYCTTQLPLESGQTVIIYRKWSLFGPKYVARFDNQEVKVTLYK